MNCYHLEIRSRLNQDRDLLTINTADQQREMKMSTVFPELLMRVFSASFNEGKLVNHVGCSCVSLSWCVGVCVGVRLW